MTSAISRALEWRGIIKLHHDLCPITCLRVGKNNVPTYPVPCLVLQSREELRQLYQEL